MGKGGRLLSEKRGDLKLEYISSRIKLISDGRFKMNPGTLSRIERGRRIPRDRARIAVLEIAYGLEKGTLQQLFKQDIMDKINYARGHTLLELTNQSTLISEEALHSLYEGKPHEAQSKVDEMIGIVHDRLDKEANYSPAVSSLRVKLADLYCKAIWVQHALSKPETVFQDTIDDYREALRLFKKVIATTQSSPITKLILTEATYGEVEAVSLLADTYYIERRYRYGARFASRVLQNSSVYSFTKQRSLRAWLLCSALSNYRDDNVNVSEAIEECTAFISASLEENTPQTVLARMALWESLARAYLAYAQDEKFANGVQDRLKEVQAFADKMYEELQIYRQNWEEPLPSFQFHLIRTKLNMLKLARRKRLAIEEDDAIALAQQGFALARPNYLRFWLQTKDAVEKLRIAHHFKIELENPPQ